MAWTPCSIPDYDFVNGREVYRCPFSDDPTSDMCRNYCGEGVDENPYPEEEVEEGYEIKATCSLCGTVGTYMLDSVELADLIDYENAAFGNHKPIQDILPDMPSWIRASVSKGSNGFCICPKCSGMEG